MILGLTKNTENHFYHLGSSRCGFLPARPMPAGVSFFFFFFTYIIYGVLEPRDDSASVLPGRRRVSARVASAMPSRAHLRIHWSRRASRSPRGRAARASLAPYCPTRPMPPVVESGHCAGSSSNVTKASASDIAPDGSRHLVFIMMHAENNFAKIRFEA